MEEIEDYLVEELCGRDCVEDYALKTEWCAELESCALVPFFSVGFIENPNYCLNLYAALVDYGSCVKTWLKTVVPSRERIARNIHAIK